jgi:hypothetical protein
MPQLPTICRNWSVNVIAFRFIAMILFDTCEIVNRLLFVEPNYIRPNPALPRAAIAGIIPLPNIACRSSIIFVFPLETWTQPLTAYAA